MRRLVFIFSMLLLSAVGSAQLTGQKKLDSLLSRLPAAKEDSNKVNLLIGMCDVYLDLGDLTIARQHAQEAKALSGKIRYERGTAKALYKEGSAYYFEGKYEEAMKFYNPALQLFEKTGDVKSVAVLCINIGRVMNMQSKIPEAIAWENKALQKCKEAGYKRGECSALFSLGSIYTDQGDFKQALKTNYAALRISEELNDKGLIANAHHNIGGNYRGMEKYTESIKEEQLALKIFDELDMKRQQAEAHSGMASAYLDLRDERAWQEYSAAIDIAEKTGNPLLIMRIREGMARYYSIKGDHARSFEEYTKVLKHHKETGDQWSESLVYIKIADELLSMGRNAEAKTYGLQGLKIARDNNFTVVLSGAYGFMTLVDSVLGDFRAAYEHEKLYNLYKDSLHNDEVNKTALETKMQYEFDKKEALAKAEQAKKDAVARLTLQRQRTFTGIGIAAAFFLLAVSGFILRSNKNLAREKKKSEELLLNILPEEVADELKDRGATTAKQFEDVTVLFTDFVDFTIASERMGTKMLVEELHNCFKAFDDIISKYNIEKIKTIGDAYLAVGGLPLPDSRHALNVVSAAEEIRSFMLARRQQLGENTFEIRIGVHSGPVVAGIVGVKKFAYDIWGDTVNTAARMEQSSAPGKINISQATYELIKDQRNCTYRGEIQAKNKGNMKMYFVEKG